ncbi:MAG: alpha/beta fold hydrolase [Nitrospirae bacterium]|nr:alpha/beta fold hydrolase [Nitrospirota bacterium]
MLNRGSDVEIKGDKIPLPAGQFKMIDFKDYDKVYGTVTDGAAKIILQLTVKHNKEAFSGRTWYVIDPQVSGYTPPSILGTLMDGETAVDFLPLTFDGDTAEAVYRAPETFVRWQTSEESDDKDRPYRQIQPTLDLVSYLEKKKDTLPQIALRRPPVVLVHGLWGCGNKKPLDNNCQYTWKEFEPKFNEKGLYDIVSVDYFSTNASSFAANAKYIKLGINDAIGQSKKQKYAATKVDIIGHSMGGLLPREYCKGNSDECNKRIHKFITIDTPHKGSELANLINTINQQPDSLCFLTLPIMEGVGKKIWENKDTGSLKGALIDLAVGSTALQNLTTTIPWTAIVGRAVPGSIPFSLFAHDMGLNVLWWDLALLCNKVPDASFTFIPDLLGIGNLEYVFPGENDRIVSSTSQLGYANEYFVIWGVDHLTVLKDSDTVEKVKEILEKP